MSSARSLRALRRFSTAVAATAILALSTAGLANASSVDVSVVDVTAPTGAVTLTAGGAGGAITINLSVTGNQVGTATFEVYRDWDLDNGVFTGSNPQEFTVAPRSAASPATTFSTTGTVTVDDDETAGEYTLSFGAFDITNSNQTGAKLAVGGSSSYEVTVEEAVVTPTNNAPTVAVTGVVDGESYAKGSVPTATCQVNDIEDGPSSFPATLGPVVGTHSADGIGSVTASCSYTDGGGLTDTDSVTYSIADPTPPAISYTLTPPTPNGANGWYDTDVTLTWQVTDPQSPGSVVKTGCVDQTITADQTEVTYTCSATSAGGNADEVEVTIKRDATKPGIFAVVDPAAANVNGWYNENVTVSFECSDGTSGVDTCSSPTTLSGDGAGQSVTGSASDVAGNVESATASGINIDKTGPTIGHTLNPGAPNANGWFNQDVTVTFSCDDTLSGIVSCLADGEAGNSKTLGEGAGQSVSGTATDAADNTATDSATGIDIDKTAPTVGLVGGPADGGNYYYGFVPAAPTCDASDALSGLDGTCSVTGYSNAVGTHTISATATDLAGNTTTTTATYTVNAWTLNGFFQPVDMGGVWNTVKAGSTVPLKFRLFAGATELTNTSYVDSFTVVKINCTTGAEDAVETLATTGGTVLRYDTTGSQFIQNWKTPSTKGCYLATMTADDGGTISAKFQLK